eukprot:TRINITY_DN4582_c0_g1_i1.p1 TRINITY_DN4582_c0_g1~~TRINITY_DN4582_c0_g1_i1.p1  ORF type:complete len:858 (-),score=154.26 TRINITY_DN4582_c0_g1_i1:13-2586(-)
MLKLSLIFLILSFLLSSSNGACISIKEGTSYELYSTIQGSGVCGDPLPGDFVLPTVDFLLPDLKLNLSAPGILSADSDTSATIRGLVVGFTDPTVEFDFQVLLSGQSCVGPEYFIIDESCFLVPPSLDLRDTWTFYNNPLTPIFGVFIATNGSKYDGARIIAVQNSPFQFGIGGTGLNLGLGGRLEFIWMVDQCDYRNLLCQCPTSAPTTPPSNPGECPDILTPPTPSEDPYEKCFPQAGLSKKSIFLDDTYFSKRQVNSCPYTGPGVLYVSSNLCPVPRPPIANRSEGIAGVNIEITQEGTNANGTIKLNEYNPVVRNKASALGIPPETSIQNAVSYFSIGFGGQFIVTMATAFKSKLYLYELTYGSFLKCDFPEEVLVEVSDSLAPNAVWYDLGVYSNVDTIRNVTCADRNRTDVFFDDIAIIEIDIDALINDTNAPNCFLYVRLTDRSNPATFLRPDRPDANADSFDLVGIVSTVPCTCTDLCTAAYPKRSSLMIYGSELFYDESRLGKRQNGLPVDPNSRLPDSPLGPPDDSSNSTNPNADAFALGFGGQITIEMSNWFSPHDLTFWASSPAGQCDPRLGTTAVIEVAQNKEGPYYYLAFRNTFTACLPSLTAGHVRGLNIQFTPETLDRLWGFKHPECFRFVRITDRTNPSVWEVEDPYADGVHVNAITAMHECDCIELQIPTASAVKFGLSNVPSDIVEDEDYDCARTSLYLMFPGVFAQEIMLYDLATNVLSTYRNHADMHYIRVYASVYDLKMRTSNKLYSLGSIPAKCGMDNIVDNLVADICIIPTSGTEFDSVAVYDDENNVVNSFSNVQSEVCLSVIRGVYKIETNNGRKQDITVEAFDDVNVNLD